MTTDTKPALAEAALAVSGMDCASCVAHVQHSATKIPGVDACEVNLARGRAVVHYDPHKTTDHAIAEAITEGGYPTIVESASPDAEAHRIHHQEEHANAWLRRAIVAMILWLPLEITHWTMHFMHIHAPSLDWVALVTSTIAIIYAGGAFYRSAFGALRRRTSNMDTLIAMGTSVAYVYSLAAFLGIQLHWWQHVNLYFMEATGLLALISLGHYLEARARGAAGSAIHQLLSLAPPTAQRISSEGQPAEIPVSELHIADQILIRPGDRVPIDSVVTDGISDIDESMITGEPIPVRREVGDEIIGGTINQQGRLIARVTKVGADTALAQIIRLVEQAQASKPPVQKLADRIAAIFVPSVLGIALVTGIGWYIWGAVHHWESLQTWGAIANAVCSVLLIACPCALGLAVPAALMVGTGRGARRGILIRDISGLEAAERITTVVLDKTGTLTRGKPSVANILPANGFSEDEILALAASVEQFSEHPLAKAIVQHARHRHLQLQNSTDFHNEPGLGVQAQIDGGTIFVGQEELIARNGAKIPEWSADGSIVHVARKHSDSIELLGSIAISDQLKDDSATAIAELHRLGLKTILLTGDNAKTAQAIARATGIDDVRANVRPAGKADVIRDLQSQSSVLSPQSSIAMVGDGINDAPALATADLAIAIGTGSDVAKETGDIVLVSGSLHGVPTAIRLSRVTMRIIRQNLFFAFLYNVLAIPLAAFGLLNPLIAAAAMALSDVTVLGNALRLRGTKID